jgi:hypothetical protein
MRVVCNQISCEPTDTKPRGQRSGKARRLTTESSTATCRYRRSRRRWNRISRSCFQSNPDLRPAPAVDGNARRKRSPKRC